MANENKTKVRLEISKTIQPKQFEPIKVIVDIEETIVWTDSFDRAEKMEICTGKLINDFVTTFDLVVKRIGEENRCIGRVITGGDVPVEAEKKVVSADDEEWDIN